MLTRGYFLRSFIPPRIDEKHSSALNEGAGKPHGGPKPWSVQMMGLRRRTNILYEWHWLDALLILGLSNVLAKATTCLLSREKASEGVPVPHSGHWGSPRIYMIRSTYNSSYSSARGSAVSSGCLSFATARHRRVETIRETYNHKI